MVELSCQAHRSWSHDVVKSLENVSEYVVVDGLYFSLAFVARQPFANHFLKTCN